MYTWKNPELETEPNNLSRRVGHTYPDIYQIIREDWPSWFNELHMRHPISRGSTRSVGSDAEISVSTHATPSRPREGDSGPDIRGGTEGRGMAVSQSDACSVLYQPRKPAASRPVQKIVRLGVNKGHYQLCPE